MTDPFDLQRFVAAQQPVYAGVVEELRQGRKTSHWMWFIFPQLRGLGQSEMAYRYGIAGLDEARAYLAHPVLGARLKECTELVIGAQGRTLREILGGIDALKFRSSMTLFARANGEGRPFDAALGKYCPEGYDARTLELLGADDG